MKFYGQWIPPVDKFIYERYFLEKRGGFFIEAGAFDGLLECSCKFLEESMGWSGINIEPVPVLFKLLCENRPDRTSMNLCCALAEKNGKMKFKQAIHPERGSWFGNGSLDHFPEHLKELEEQQCRLEEFEVETRTYASLVDSLPIPVPDLMVLDVEGYELKVMEGMKGSQKLPRLMCVEYRPARLPDITKAMEGLGYKVDTLCHNNAYYIRT